MPTLAYDPYYGLIFVGYLFISSIAIAVLLIIWNETNAFVEYLRLIGFKMSEYEYDEKLGISYPDHLEAKYNNFIARLIACPICLAVWLNFGAYFVHKFEWASVCGVYFSLMFYFFFKIIMKKSDG